MADNKNQTDQQVKDKIKSYNKQRGGTVIVGVLFIGLVFLAPAVVKEALPVRLSVFCSAVLLLCCVAFVLSFRCLLLLFFTTTSVTAVLLVLNQIHFELFLFLSLINAGMVFISSRTSKAIIQSFTNDIETTNRLKVEATTDSLTLLLNRNGMEQVAGTAWAFCKRDKKKAGIILADIDYFKNYNDTFGHLEGDNILRQVADSIKACIKRETDIISRIGGDEFLIFLSDINDSHVLEIAQSLSSAVTNLKVKTTPENNSYDFLSVSMGIATSVPQPDDVLIDLYKAADKALYHAKKAGRNCISYNEKIIQSGTSTGESSPIEILPTSFACMNNED